jgi:Raf kinase inhibitor-like YbhB/YbcL family protein
MSLTTTAWEDGGIVPVKYSQAGAELSPPLAWSEAPQGTVSFVLMVHDADAVSAANLQQGLLHWLAWNIPATARSLPEGYPQGPQQPDGTRQISASGPYYRGPAAPATGVEHHYLFELFALDTLLTVEPVGASVNETRAAVMAAMAGRVRGKALLVGRYRRP